MNEYDDLIRRKAHEEEPPVPEYVLSKIEETLESLPEQSVPMKQVRVHIFPKVASIAACFLFVCLVVFPNCSVAYAKALENIPVIGEIVKVVTIRNYFYSDGNHELNIDVPEIVTEGNDAVDYINKDVDSLTKILADKFYSDLEEYGYESYGSIRVTHEVVTNTEKWFTLKICVHETVASSNTYYKYYHLDKMSGKVVSLGDLSENEKFFDVIENEIKRQMQELMSSDPNQKYWEDDAVIGEDFVKLSETHNFYWGENGDLIIVFDKYEVAPGAMGTPEFTISRNVIADMLIPEYRTVFLLLK